VSTRAGVPSAVFITEPERDRLLASGWREVATNQGLNFRSSWGAWEVIREFVQNALDETEAFTFSREAGNLVIEDKGRGLGIKALGFGESKTSPGLRGEFGEGLKIAVAVALRNKWPVDIESAGYDFLARTREIEGPGGSVTWIHWYWKKNARASGTRVILRGYTGSEYRERFVQTAGLTKLLDAPAAMMPRSDETSTSQYEPEPTSHKNALFQNPPVGDVSVEELRSRSFGKLFVKDIYVKDIPSQWSYNLWGVRLNQDRNEAANPNYIPQDAARLWAFCISKPLITKLLTAMQDEKAFETRLSFGDALHYSDLNRYVGFGKAYDGALSRTAVWKEAAKDLWGAKAVFSRRGGSEVEAAKHLGYKVVTNLPYALSGFVDRLELLPTAASVQDQWVERVKTNEKLLSPNDLPPTARVHLEVAKALARDTVNPPPKDVFARADMPRMAGSGSRTAGYYDRVARVIVIQLEKLVSFELTLDVLIHEMGHHVSQAADLTDGHVNATTRVAAEISKMMERGWLGVELRALPADHLAAFLWHEGGRAWHEGRHTPGQKADEPREVKKLPPPTPVGGTGFTGETLGGKKVFVTKSGRVILAE